MTPSDPLVDALLALVERRCHQPLDDERRRMVRDAIESSGVCDQDSALMVPDGIAPAAVFRPYSPHEGPASTAAPDGATRG